MLTGIERKKWAGFLKIHPDLVLADLGIVYVDLGLLGLEVADKGDGSGLASVAGVGLECESKDSNALER